MKKLLIAIICALIVTSMIHAQENIDVIYLKNGDIVKGIIIENAPNDYVKIQLQGGSIFTYKYSDIQKFTTEFRSQEKPKTTGSDANKMMLYETGKKNPTLAVLLSCLLSSTGHAYAGNWGRGLLFTGGRVGCAIFAMTAGIEEKTEYYGYYYEETTVEITGAYYIGMGGVMIISIWEMIDAASEAKRYNMKLHNRIFSNQPDFGLNIVPTKDGGKLMLSCNF